jgi:hypothetical protein
MSERKVRNHKRGGSHLEDGPVLCLQLHEVGVLVDGGKWHQVSDEGPAKGACQGTDEAGPRMLFSVMRQQNIRPKRAVS